MRIALTNPKWWSVHTHSKYSFNDALPSVEEIVVKAASLNHQAVGLTDHGNTAGAVELYQECMKRGLKPFPGTELYFVPDIAQHKADYANSSVKAVRYHLGVVAYSAAGYRNLMHLNTLSHSQHFHKPLVDFTSLAQLAEDARTEGLAVLTGCFFGYAQQVLINEGEEACERFIATLESWFPGSVYVELQNHNIDHGGGCFDSDVADQLQGLADRMGLPTVITQDSHYLELEDRSDHESLKRLVAFGPEADDAVFPGDGFHYGDDQWIGHHHRGHRLERGLEGLADLLSRGELRIPVLDSYAYSIPRVVADPERALEERCAISLAYVGLFTKKIYRSRVVDELNIIKDSGMDGYMMLVAMITDYMRENGIVYQTRGSAAGSLVCYLLGITNVDPLRWDLRFERFISRDRTKPPDIDLDIANDRRQEVIDWLNTKFAANQIGTWAVYGLKPEDKKKQEEDDSGSLLKRYFSRQKYAQHPIHDLKDIPREDMEQLHRLDKRDLYSGMGKNAAGVVITSTHEEFNQLVPLAHMNSGRMITQYSKDLIEDLGLVKLDVLGSKTLTVLQRCLLSMGEPMSYLDEIPLNDKPTFAFMRKGDLSGVFQLEGKTSQLGVKRLKPTHIKHVIAAMALFRPATMRSGGTEAYISRKNGKDTVPERHELLMSTLKDTHGVVLYQEQVIDILRTLGMDADNLTKFLKAVKASNKNIGDAGKVIEGYRDWLDDQLTKQGFNDEDRKFLDEAIAGFAEYGFNRAHATVYGITAYRCAWLAMHHPLHFHAALLAVATGDKDKEPLYIAATKRRGIRISSADINGSGASYRVDPGGRSIRCGLQSIFGLGEVTAQYLEQHQPYTSVQDLLERTEPRPVTGRKNYVEEMADGEPADLSLLSGVLGKLFEFGALDSII